MRKKPEKPRWVYNSTVAFHALPPKPCLSRISNSSMGLAHSLRDTFRYFLHPKRFENSGYGKTTKREKQPEAAAAG